MDHQLTHSPKSRIAQLVAHLSTENAASTFAQLFQSVATLGQTGYIHLLRCLFGYRFLPTSSSNSSLLVSQTALDTTLRYQLRYTLTRCTFADTVAHVFADSLFAETTHDSPELVVGLKHVPFTWLQNLVSGDPLQALALTVYCQAPLCSLFTEQSRTSLPTYLEHVLTLSNPPSEPPRALLYRHLLERISLHSSFSHLSPTLLDRVDTTLLHIPTPMAFQKLSLDGILRKEGPPCLNDHDTFTNVLKSYEAHGGSLAELLDERNVVSAFQFMGQSGASNSILTSSKGSEEWNYHVFVSVVKSMAPHINWTQVVSTFSTLENALPSPKIAQVLITCYSLAEESNGFPVAAVSLRWKDVHAQFRLLSTLLTNPPTSGWDLTGCNTIIKPHGLPVVQVYYRELASVLAASVWNSADLLVLLLDFCNSPEFLTSSKSVLAAGMEQSPELLLLGLVQLDPPLSPFIQTCFSRLMRYFLLGQVTSAFVLSHVWPMARTLVFSTMLELYKQDNGTMVRMVELSHKFRAEEVILSAKQFPFVLDFALVCHRRGYLAFDHWLAAFALESGTLAISAILEYIRYKFNLEAMRQEGETVPKALLLHPNEIALLIKLCAAAQLSAEQMAFLKALYTTFGKLQPGLAAACDEVPLPVAVEVEKTAESFYLRLYKGEITIGQLLEYLTILRDSLEARDNKIFLCVVSCLLDEYKFLTNYPEKELTIYSYFFGSMLAQALFPRPQFALAVKLLVEALQSDTNGPLFRFGTLALAQLKECLNHWPVMCRVLGQITSFMQSKVEVANYVRSLLEVIKDPTFASYMVEDPYYSFDGLNIPGLDVIAKEDQPVPFPAVAISTAPDGLEFMEPNEEIRDKIHFIMNNVAQNNLDTKGDEMKEVLDRDTYLWFCKTILVQRASNQPNYHGLYIELLEHLDNKILFRCVLHETFVNIRILLNSDVTLKDFAERSHLKNLGAWLGGLTLARNKPIKHNHVAFKELLLQGYDSGRLIVAIPFVCRVLEQASKSHVFKPPNPWVMAIMKVLVELYKFAELKLNLRFEIEVLCKALSLDLNTIEPTQYLSSRPVKPATASTVATPMEAVKEETSRPAGLVQFAYVPPTLHTPNEITTNIIELLASNIKFNSIQSLVQAHPVLKTPIVQRMEQLLKDVMPVQVARAVLIASTSTQDLIMKDFCMEPSEDKVRWAAQKMVRGVAGTLAIAQCRKPLQDGLYTHLKELLVQKGFAGNLADQVAVAIVTENLELVCAIVEMEATNRAAQEIDECLNNAYVTRKRHRERTGQPYYDMAVYNELKYPANLPAVLKIRPQALQPQQLQVYEDFSNIPHFASQAASSGAKDTAGGTQTEPSLTARQCLDKFWPYVSELDKLVTQTQINTLAELPQKHDIRLLMAEVVMLVIRSAQRHVTALDFTQVIVQLLFKNEGNLSREVFVVLLDKICRLSPKALREVTHWLTYADDERKYNIPVTVALIRARLINLAEQDSQLAKLMESGRASVMDFTTRLIRKCVLDPQPCAIQADFGASIKTLQRAVGRGRTPTLTEQLLKDLGRQAQPLLASPTDVVDNREYPYRTALEDWMRVCEHPRVSEKQLVTFVIHLQKQIQLDNPEVHASFFYICFSAALHHYEKSRTIALGVNSVNTEAYSALDALAKLTVLLSKYPVARNGQPVDTVDESAVTSFRSILSYITLLLVLEHQRREQLFNQKPYFRFLVCVLDELREELGKTTKVHLALLSVVADTLQAVQPGSVPGFSFAWVSLVAHRFFLPHFLMAEERWPVAERLLIDALRFIAPALYGNQLDEAVRLLYKGIVRIMLVILHDFPEFLCDYFTSFCDVIPVTCVQMRNLVVSAYARDMCLPEPLSQDLHLEELPEVQQDPRILSDYTTELERHGLKDTLRRSLEEGQVDACVTKFTECVRLQPVGTEPHPPQLKYNIPLINSVVLHCGVLALAREKQVKRDTAANNRRSMTTSAIGKAVFEFFNKAFAALPTDARYLMLNAMANLLRHPSSHTYYFSRILLTLFTEGQVEEVKEQITRVLIERAVVNRPLPWGLLVTLIDLMSNGEYKFWDHKFTTIAPEIAHILQAVSDSITSSA
ncbi:CCR4-NOT core subunit cdc39 [Dispira simplex]|nr:CCR4-NOT core subunit cdc39 [Dispira simplex]